MKKWQLIVRELMNEKKLSQKELSKLSGITEASISRYLSEEREPRMDIIINFSKALGVTPNLILGYEETEEGAYEKIKAAIARNGGELSSQEKTELIKFLLSKE